MEGQRQYVIIDNGSGFCKAGFSGGLEPKVVIPSVVGHPKVTGIESPELNSYFGQNALDNSQILHITRPVQSGIVTDWKEMTLFWSNLYENELNIDSSQYGVIMPEKQLTPKFIREKMTELFFETFQVPSIFITSGAVLALYGAGKFSGIVVDSGYDATFFVPISNGFPFSSAIKKLNFGGQDITDYFQQLLKQKGYNSIPNVNYLKEQYCYVSKSPETEIANEISYTLPDKTIIKLKDECFHATELLFHPEYFGKELGGIARKLCESIYLADHYIKKEIEGNIVLTGGNTMFPGFAERFSSEILQVANGLYKNRANVIAIPERKYVTWIGASIATHMPIFSGLQTTRKEYDEYGPSIVHNKCFY